MNSKVNDLTGKRFGKLLVLGLYCTNRNTKWNCLCDCGNSHIVRSSHLLSGNIKSCGCFKSEFLSKANSTHGLKKHPLYCVWRTIKARCLNPNHKSYKQYGGRGITICKEWMSSEVFIKWAISNGWSPGLQIDRYPDNNAGYQPTNCRFVTSKVNNNNTRKSLKVEYNGRLYNSMELSAISIGISQPTIRQRLLRNWSVEKAISTPPFKRRYK